MFVPNQKIKLVTENTLIVDKLYYESKLAEQEAREQGLLDKDKRKEIEAEIVERRADAVLIATTPEDYGKEVRFWANKTEVQELDGGKVSLQEYRAEQIIKNAIERDNEQKTLLALKNMIELIEFFNQKGVFSSKVFLNPLSILLLPTGSLSFRFLEQWLSLKEISSVKERKQESKEQGEERNSSEDPKE